ncbi:MAG: hypothetical protein D6746_05085 [Bacteroidetes bacterium]|nr:MAG: hypothetical protein D6746_05085 [Bacteroidota bacterium]
MALKQKQAAAKGAADAIKGLNKTYDTWRIYAKDLENLRANALNEVYQALRSGDSTTAMMISAQRAQQLANYANSGKQVGDVVFGLIKQASQDPRIRADKFAEWLIQTQLYDKDGKLKPPDEVPVEEFTLERLMQMPGASAWLDNPKALRSVADTIFEKQDFEDTLGSYKITGTSSGFYFFEREKARGKIRPYEYVDKVNRTVGIKKPEQLLQEGILTDFMQDPVAARIIDDEAARRYKDVNDETRAKALYDLLNHRSLHDGSIRILKDEQIQRSPWISAGGSSKKEVVIDPIAVTVAQAFNGSLPGATVSLRDVKAALPVQVPDTYLDGFIDVSNAFGGAEGLTTLLEPFYATKISGERIELPASRVFVQPDLQLLVVEYRDKFTNETHYKAFSPQGAARGTAPAYQLFDNMKSGRTIINNLKKAKVIDEANNFRFDLLAQGDPTANIMATGPFAGVSQRVGAKDEAMAPVIGSEEKVPVRQGKSVIDLLSNPETVEEGVTQLRRAAIGTVVDTGDGKTATVTDIYIEPPSLRQRLGPAAVGLMGNNEEAMKRAQYRAKVNNIIVKFDDGRTLSFDDPEALVTYLRNRLPVRRAQ